MKIKRGHTLGAEEAKRRVIKIAGELENRFNLRSEWEGDDLRVNGSGVDGRIIVNDQSVEVQVRLGMSLVLLEGSIRSEIEKVMDEYLT